MHGHRQVALGRGLEYGMEEALSEQPGRTARHQHLNEPLVGCAATDLARGGLGIRVVHHDGAAKPRRPPEPALGEVPIIGGGDLVPPVGIRVHGNPQHVRPRQDREVDAEAIEVIRDHEIGIAAGHRTGRGAGILALHPDRRVVAGPGHQDAVVIRVGLPRAWQVGPEFLAHVRERVVHVGVDEAGSGSDRRGVFQHKG